MPRFQNYGYSNMAYHLAGTTNLRTDLYQVTEAYWVSYKRVLCIKYITESGMTTQTLVTDDILPEFLKVCSGGKEGYKNIRRQLTRKGHLS